MTEVVGQSHTREFLQNGEPVLRMTLEFLKAGTLRMDFGFVQGKRINNPDHMPPGGRLMLCFKGDSEPVAKSPSPSEPSTPPEPPPPPTPPPSPKSGLVLGHG